MSYRYVCTGYIPPCHCHDRDLSDESQTLGSDSYVSVHDLTVLPVLYLDSNLESFRFSRIDSDQKTKPPIMVLYCSIGTMIKKKPGKRHCCILTSTAHVEIQSEQMKGSKPIVVLYCSIGAMIKKKPGKRHCCILIFTAPVEILSEEMKGSISNVFLYCNIGTIIEKYTCKRNRCILIFTALGEILSEPMKGGTPIEQ